MSAAPKRSEANPRVMAQDFLATLVVWDAALGGTLGQRELYAARELFATFDPKGRRDEIQKGLMHFAQLRAVNAPIDAVDAEEIKRVFAALPFGPMDDVSRQILFTLWLWSRFDRERVVVRDSIVATRGTLLAQVKKLTELSQPFANRAVPVGAELLSVDVALERFLTFLSATTHPENWGLHLAHGLARAALDWGGSEGTTGLAPAELLAAIWCSFRIDDQSFAAIASRAL